MFKFVCGGGEILWKYLASQITQSFPLSDCYALHAASSVFQICALYHPVSSFVLDKKKAHSTCLILTTLQVK